MLSTLVAVGRRKDERPAAQGSTGWLSGVLDLGRLDNAFGTEVS